MQIETILDTTFSNLFSGTWIFKKSSEKRSLRYEKPILGKLLGPTRMNNGIWRIKYNSGLNRPPHWSSG